ncbi:MAG TPA: Hint domain-containing protein, partial [Streptosporangiaceae bacterium]|nr:Hint domain-containing protein [Streptosporangiaceae bacterium]
DSGDGAARPSGGDGGGDGGSAGGGGKDTESPGTTAEDDAPVSCRTGGESFTATTRVLTATGHLVAISKVRPGDKVLATNTKSGKTSAEPVAAVLVRHDSDLYDLRVATGHGTAVIDTTRNHLFWGQLRRDARRIAQAPVAWDPDHGRPACSAACYPRPGQARHPV